MTGLKPRDFVWIIAGRLAVSQRIGGYGFQHRRVRREEEIAWLQHDAKINTVVSLLSGNQNVNAYEDVDFVVYHEPLAQEFEMDRDLARILATLDEAVGTSGAVVLVHRDTVDDTIAGVLGGYLLYSGLLTDPIQAAAIIQEILGRPLGPLGRSMMTRSQPV